jgi:hypothetical protein
MDKEISGRCETMTPTSDPGTGVAADQANSRQLNDLFHLIDARLGAMVEAYQEKPSIIDSSVLDATGDSMNVEATITEAYRIVKTHIYAKDSFLRPASDVWEAFNEQKDEFIGFYRSALRALEIYQEVLAAYSLLHCKAKPEPQHGDLAHIRQDKHAQVAERDRCIEAISDFHGKFSAMLSILYAADINVNSG